MCLFHVVSAMGLTTNSTLLCGYRHLRDDSYGQDLSKIRHTRQEEDDHHRVNDGEPVNLDIAHGQVCVPSRRPLHLTLL